MYEIVLFHNFIFRQNELQVITAQNTFIVKAIKRGDINPHGDRCAKGNVPNRNIFAALMESQRRKRPGQGGRREELQNETWFIYRVTEVREESVGACEGHSICHFLVWMNESDDKQAITTPVSRYVISRLNFNGTGSML